MAKENEALVIIEEGIDIEVQPQGLACCFTVFVFLH